VQIKNSLILFSIIVTSIVLVLIIEFAPDNVFRIVLGLPVALLFPGYSLISVLSPKKEILNNIERMAISFGLSLAIVPIIGLIIDYTPWKLSLNSILYSVAGFVLLFSVIAFLRQLKLANEEKPSIHFDFTWWNSQKAIEKILSVILIFAAIGTIGVLFYVIAVPNTSSTYTEFYMLNEEGSTNDYPSEIDQGDTGIVTLYIINHEQCDITYRIDITIDENTGDSISPVVLQSIDLISLENEEKYETLAEFRPQNAGDDQKVEFLLYTNESSDPYMQLSIWVNVN
jgi:uncharacterized membrane protein